MQFDDFDQRIKEAADNHHPTYDEKAWDKMEALLDKHMPQPGKKRRRFFFFWLFVLLLLGGGAAWLFMEKPWKSEEPAIAVASTGSEKNTDRKVTPGSATENRKVTTSAKDATITTGNTNADGSSVTTATDTDKKIVEPAGAGLLSDQKKFVQPAGIGLNKEAEQLITTNSPGIGKKKKTTKAAPVNDKAIVSVNDPDKIAEPVTMQKKETPSINTNSDPAAVVSGNKPVSTVTPTSVNEEKKPAADQPAIAEPKAEAPVATEPVAKKQAAKQKEKSPFFISVSAGPDMSAVGTSTIGKTRLLTGAGLGYTFKNRFTVRTGFYMANKVYTASPEQYKPGVPIPGIQYLTKIDADCKVYEIPLSLSYNFSRSEKQGFFGGAAVSSLIMKKEDYDYVYNYPGQPTYTYRHSVNNENKHLFSILTLSGGYQRKLSNTFSIAAEPYVKIPLTGVGLGNIKLSGTGVLFSVLVKPFNKHIKKTTALNNAVTK
ncbi:MAG: hypothetical protein J0L56_19045 [Chitinophagales bacterium]|nr:hypothetical protein [Chitinophagales bacterium]